uniref:C-X-C motif chemokine n=1 Tax=Denticeps clupeoides TaxID=299321 RepID=A0AAY4CCX3_9TELE
MCVLHTTHCPTVHIHLFSSRDQHSSKTIIRRLLVRIPICQGQRESRERCKCVGPGQNVLRLQLVENIEVYMPSPSCSKQEIIATFKGSGVQKCLNPESTFGQNVMIAIQKR